jgi:hypothetical protein
MRSLGQDGPIKRTSARPPATLAAAGLAMMGGLTKTRILPLGATAEWIHERPAKVGKDRYPMPDCGEVIFKHCFAWSAPDLGTPMVLQRLDEFGRLIRMVETFDAPHRPALVSIPQKENATSLSIRYYGPGTSHCSHAW